MNLKTVEWLSNTLTLHLKLIRIVNKILINFGQKYTNNDLNDPWVVAIVI